MVLSDDIFFVVGVDNDDSVCDNVRVDDNVAAFVVADVSAAAAFDKHMYLIDYNNNKYHC